MLVSGPLAGWQALTARSNPWPLLVRVAPSVSQPGSGAEFVHSVGNEGAELYMHAHFFFPTSLLRGVFPPAEERSE